MTPPDRVADWVALVDAYYPEATAESWDRVGLQVGDPQAKVSAVLVCLDVTLDTVAEAVSRGADLVLAHHPLLFRPLARLTPDTAAGRIALAAARAGVAVLAAHTNFDVAVDGTTQPIVAALDLTGVGPLIPGPRSEREASCKLVTFVPPADSAAVIAALSAAGAGRIGDYDGCAYRVRGTGMFRPSSAANPAVGARNVHNEVAEDRIEMVLPQAQLASVVAALRAAHPYEEVAYDVYPLLDGGHGSARDEGPDRQDCVGMGRVGNLPRPLSLRDIGARLAAVLAAPDLRVAGDLDRPIRRVAACGGAGDSLIPAALAVGADVFVTGDLRHHVALDALTMGLALIDAGHYPVEAAALPALRHTLATAAQQRGLSATLLASALRTHPWSSHKGAP